MRCGFKRTKHDETCKCSRIFSQFPLSIVSSTCVHTQEAIGLCEAAGFGPEDPASEICAAAVISGCKVIAKDLANHITDPHKICQDMDLCPK